jgi:putative transposase
VKYQFIKDNSQNYPVSLQCKVMEIKRCGYYHWQKRRCTQRRIEEDKFLVLLKRHYQLSKGRYGLLRLVKSIRKEGTLVNKKRIYRLMKKHGIFSRTKKKFKVTTKQKAGAGFIENLLNGRFQAAGNNQIWTSDITYIRTKQGWMYLAVVLDIYNRKIIGWSLSQRPSADLVVRAFIMAVMNSKPIKGVIFHSDRGSQYTSNKMRSILAHYGFRQSMSGKGNCYDNAITETFFSTLKKELVYLTEFETREHARTEIFEFIEIFYNRQRLHSSLGYLSPIEFEKNNL